MDFQNCPQCETLNPPGAKRCEQCKAELPEVPDFAPPPPPPVAEPEPPSPSPEAATKAPAPFEAAPEVLARIPQLEADIAKRPNANALYLQLCQIYVDGKRTDLAAGVLERCLEHDPKNVYIRHRLGQLTGVAPQPVPIPPAPSAPGRAATVGVRTPTPGGTRPPSLPLSRPVRRSSRKRTAVLAGAVALVAVGLAVKWIVFPSTRRVVTGSFSAFGPKWSPTGRQLAFLMQEAETTKLGVYDLGKGSHRVLSALRGADATAYAWSPDGRRIAYVGTGEGGWEEAVFVVDVDSGQARRIASGSSPSWSADGTTLLMWCAGPIVAAEGASDEGTYVGGEPPGPCRVDVQSGEVRRSPGAADVFFGAGAAVSPTLGKIAFERMGGPGPEAASASPGEGTTAEGEFQEMVDSVAARGATNLAEGSRDLKRELEARQYMRRKRGGQGEAAPAYPSDIFVVDFDGGQPLQLTNDGRSSFPSWTPDGARILYFTAGPSGGEMWTMNADGGERRPVLKSPLKIADPAAVALTADGRYVVFVAPVEADAGVAKLMTGESPADLHVASVGSSTARRAANRHPFKQRFALSPDGKQIAYEVLAETGTLTNARTRSELWLMSR